MKITKIYVNDIDKQTGERKDPNYMVLSVQDTEKEVDYIIFRYEMVAEWKDNFEVGDIITVRGADGPIWVDYNNGNVLKVRSNTSITKIGDDDEFIVNPDLQQDIDNAPRINHDLIAGPDNNQERIDNPEKYKNKVINSEKTALVEKQNTNIENKKDTELIISNTDIVPITLGYSVELALQAWEELQDFDKKLLVKSDYQLIGNKSFKKKTKL